VHIEGKQAGLQLYSDYPVRFSAFWKQPESKITFTPPPAATFKLHSRVRYLTNRNTFTSGNVEFVKEKPPKSNQTMKQIIT
jgi:hypothetical protein